VGKRVTFSVKAWSSAPPHAVYELLRSGATWPQWTPIGSFELEDPTGAGEVAGAVRVFKTGTVRSRERLLELRPDSGISYSAFSGMPIRDHRADVDLESERGGTKITWREDFEVKIPGSGLLTGVFLRWFVQRCADGLAAQAAKQTATAP
jgi:hypothetical protein